MINWKTILLAGVAIILVSLSSFFLLQKDPATETRKETNAESIPPMIHNIVPFTAQAPLGNWEDKRQSTGCEEASAIMAIRWAENRNLSKEGALKEITASSDYQLEKYGYYEDTSAKDTLDRIFKDYFKYNNATLAYDININDIKKELADNRLVIVPINASILNNPHYKVPYHMILIVGYDDEAQEFITHDPGTRYGENFRYSYETISQALNDYTSGKGQAILQNRTAMIVVAK